MAKLFLTPCLMVKNLNISPTAGKSKNAHSQCVYQTLVRSKRVQKERQKRGMQGERLKQREKGTSKDLTGPEEMAKQLKQRIEVPIHKAHVSRGAGGGRHRS